VIRSLMTPEEDYETDTMLICVGPSFLPSFVLGL
jgi:hypothetical protein